MLQDLRYAVRSIARRPGFAAAAILTIALGIGANTAIFSAVDAILLRPVPVPWVDRLVTVRNALPGFELPDAQLSAAETEDLAARRDIFAAVGGYAGTSPTLTGEGEPRRLRGARTLGGFFDVMGARPRLGRLYRPDESEEGRHRVVVLTDALWRELSGGDPSFVGRTIRLDDQPYEVIGVLAPEFRVPRTAQLFVPFVMNATVRSPERRMSLGITAVGRLRDGLTMEGAASALRDEARRWHERNGYDPKGRHTLTVQSYAAWAAGQLRPVLLVLMGAVTLVLLIACANVASLQLVRAAGRARELAVRAALGAGRGRVARQLLAESAVLAAAGGVAGLWLGALLVQALGRWAPERWPALRALSLDGPVLAYTALATVGAGLLFGTMPALRAARVDAQEALRETSRGLAGSLGRSRLLRGSIVLQVALTLVLLAASTVTVRSLANVLDVDPGFDPARTMTVRVTTPKARYAELAQVAAFHETMLERLRALPGAEAAGSAYGLPFSDQGNSSPFDIIGAPEPSEGRRHANMWFVGGDYFRAMGIQLLRGRAFEPSDRAGAPSVVVIDEQLATQYFPGEDPIGRRISQGPEATIVGVVRSVKSSDLSAPDKATVYYPLAQAPWAMGDFAFVVRGAAPPERLAAGMRAAVAELDPQLAVWDVQSMPERVAVSLGTRRLAMAVLSGFAAVSLLLALLGIHGVVSYGTAQRTHELGIRIALGARPADVTRMVLRDGLRLAALGVALGSVAYLGASRALSAIVYGVGPRDPLMMALGVAVVVPVALLACWLPARRAARLDPMVALRND
jgi:predicted permease